MITIQRKYYLAIIPVFAAIFLSACAVANPNPTANVCQQHICLSLRNLSDCARDAQTFGHGIPEMAYRLGGISAVDGIIVDETNQDLVLVGRHQAKRAPLTINDLVLHLRIAFSGGEAPYCSLDPRPEDIRKMNELFASRHPSTKEELHQLFLDVQKSVGPQTVVIGGPGISTNFAGLPEVMIYADYAMKKMSQNHILVPDVPSLLQMQMSEAIKLAEQGKNAQEGVSMSRFWFHIAEGEPTFEESSNMIRLNKCSVIVLTEHELTQADGKLCDGGVQDPIAQAWAENYSKHLNEAIELSPEIGNLENHYRLSALIRGAVFRSSAQRIKLDFSFLRRDYRYTVAKQVPVSLPGIANYAEKAFEVATPEGQMEWYFMPMVCGGVCMDINLAERQFANNSKIAEQVARVLTARPEGRSLVWQVIF